jgi:hypothetical protein
MRPDCLDLGSAAASGFFRRLQDLFGADPVSASAGQPQPHNTCQHRTAGAATFFCPGADQPGANLPEPFEAFAAAGRGRWADGMREAWAAGRPLFMINIDEVRRSGGSGAAG